MAKTRRIKASPVMVNGGGPVNDLILPIAVHIPRQHRMGTLADITAVPRRVGIKRPTFRQRPITPVPGHQHTPSVITPAENRARSGTIEVSRTGQETIHSVPV